MSQTKISVVRGGDLTDHLATSWRTIQRSSPALDSPYFCPEYVRAVAGVRDDVEVAIVDDDRGLAAFFAFQRGPGRVGHPVGRRFSDFQAVVARPDARWNPRELLRASGLVAFRFDHLLDAQEPFRPFHWARASSPFVDLSGGFEAYRSAHRQAGSKEIEQIAYKSRKAERRLGPIRFELHTEDDGSFETLLRWKSAQLRSTGQPDTLAAPWVRRFLDRIRNTTGEAFAGVLSTLHLGDRLAAVHLGMRSATAFHWWIPGYDPELSAFSPGQICFVEIARAVAALGVQRIDLGKGAEAYKTRLMNGSIALAEGAVDLRPMTARLHRGWYHAAEWARRSPLRGPLLRPVRWVRRLARSRAES